MDTMEKNLTGKQSMTCVIGATHLDHVYMVSDSASVDIDSNVRTSTNEKTFFKPLDETEHVLVGMAGSWRAIQLIKHDFNFPALPRAPILSTERLDRYVSIDVVSALRNRFDMDDLKPDCKDEESPADILVGIRGHLFHIDAWYQVHHYSDIPFVAIGVGCDYCIGALDATWQGTGAVDEVLVNALHTAAKFNSKIREPFYIKTLRPNMDSVTSVVADVIQLKEKVG